MKTTNTLLLLLLVLFSLNNLTAQETHPVHNYWQLSPRVGYDLPTYNNNTPYIDYSGGLEVGASVDYYWSWFGLGADIDYIKNQPESTYPTSNLFDPVSGTILSQFSLTEEAITRIFYGIGPDFKYQSKSNKFHAELNTRVGLASIKGGRTELRETTVLNDQLNFHAGYDISNALSFKGQLRFTYFFNETFGLHLGGYYLKHLKTKELEEGGIAARYRSFNVVQDNINELGADMIREDCCEHDISSTGVFVGVTIKLKPTHTTECCTTCEKYALAVTARDKFTKELLPNTSIAVKNSAGEIVQSGVTNDFGIVVFDDVIPDNYSIEGLLHDVALENNAARKDEFIQDETLQKEIIYGDRNFIIQGNAVVCNTNQGLPGVRVILKNMQQAQEKNTVTDGTGKYIIHLSESGSYELRGIKDKYFSQTVTVEPSNYDRNQTLFVKLEICLEEADCGRAITLQNVLYDLDKFFIRNDAKPELNRLVQFMQDNPSIRVELSSHTDSRASNAYNQTLSQNRASGAVDYIVSQGINSARITGVGYGETRLLNNCGDNATCSEAEHQLNRRTEMKVICQ